MRESDVGAVNAINELRRKMNHDEENVPSSFARIRHIEQPIMPGAFGESHSYIMIGNDKYVSLKGVRAVMKLRPSYSADQIKIVYESGDDVIFDAGEGQQEKVFKEIIQMLK